MIAGSNIDDVRARIMALENAEMFDAMAWSQVLADLAAAGRLSALADAERRMETALENAKIVVGQVVSVERFALPAPVAVETVEE